MRLKRFKGKDHKRIGIIVFTISCILLVSGVILYRTFAIFEVKTNQNVINGTIQDPGNIYFAFYQKNEENGNYEIQKEMPSKNSGLVLDEDASYCGVNGNKDQSIKVSLTEDYRILISGVTTSRTKCDLYFTKGIFLMGHGVPVVKKEDGLYEVTHENVQDTLNNTGFSKAEYRYAGQTPKNYILFNGELWRIIGLVNVMTSLTEVEQRVKLIRDQNIGSYAWDNKKSGTGSSKSDYGSNDWTDSELVKYLNGDYYSNLSSSAKNFIDQDIVWNTGGVKGLSDTSIVKHYLFERGSYVDTGRKTYWNAENTVGVTFHSIGLMYPSDYGFTTTGGTLGRDYCFHSNLYDDNTGWDTECANNTWFRTNNDYIWTLTPYNDERFSIVSALFNGKEYFHYAYFSNFFVYPVVYLKPTVKIISGTGSSADAFEIAQILK